MIIDSKGKLFGKVSVIDILIVLVIAAGVAGVGYKFSQSKTGPVFSAGDKIIMTFYGEEAADYAIQAIKKGDPARDQERGTFFGNIIEDVRIDESQRYGETPTGEKVVVSKEGYPSFYVTVEAAGTMGAYGDIIIGGSEYQIGRTVFLKAGGVYVPTRIYSFEIKKQ
jgi:hypothetical protein